MICPMLAVMIWEIVLRYFFNSPSLWAYDISLFIYGGYIALGGAYTYLAGGHVNVDIIWGLLSPRGRAVLDILTSGFAFLFLGVLFRSEEHTSELQSLMRISYAVFCLKKKKQYHYINMLYNIQ